jgi:putative redox protein
MPVDSNSNLTASIDSGYRVTSVSRGHVTFSDEPEESGGADTAMSPTELLLSALASCKLATMRMVANRNNWDTSGMLITLELFREADKTTIQQLITFPDHLNEEQRKKLLAISHKCPVSKIVAGDVRILDKQ